MILRPLAVLMIAAPLFFQPIQSAAQDSDAQSKFGQALVKAAEEVGKQYNAEMYFKRGSEKHKKGKFDQAIVEFTKAIEIMPEYVEAYVYRGNLFAETKKYDLAFADFSWKAKGELVKAKADEDKAKQLGYK